MGEVITRGHIDGVEILPLKQIYDDRGALFHMLKPENLVETSIGEVYFSFVKSGVVKAWKRHKIMKQQYAVPVGQIQLVVFDNRENSKTKNQIQEINVGVNHYGLVRLPAGVWYGFKGTSENDALIVNCASHAHDPHEVERLDDSSDLIPYRW